MTLVDLLSEQTSFGEFFLLFIRIFLYFGKVLEMAECFDGTLSCW